MLVEVHTLGLSTFMLADNSNKDLEDVRAMYLEKKLNPTTHLHHWAQIPDFLPMDPWNSRRPVREEELAITDGVRHQHSLQSRERNRVEGGAQMGLGPGLQSL